jgi:hypothetical protein
VNHRQLYLYFTFKVQDQPVSFSRKDKMLCLEPVLIRNKFMSIRLCTHEFRPGPLQLFRLKVCGDFPKVVIVVNPSCEYCVGHYEYIRI